MSKSAEGVYIYIYIKPYVSFEHKQACLSRTRGEGNLGSYIVRELVAVDFVGKCSVVPSTQEGLEEGGRHYLLSGKPFMFI